MKKTSLLIALVLATGIFSYAAIVLLLSKQYLGALIFFILFAIVSNKFRTALYLNRAGSQNFTEDPDAFDTIYIKLDQLSTDDNIENRQEILRKIKNNEKPFDKLNIELHKYSVEDEDVIYVKANSEMIGNIPHYQIHFIENNRERILFPIRVNIIDDKNEDEHQNLEAELILRLFKE